MSSFQLQDRRDRVKGIFESPQGSLSLSVSPSLNFYHILLDRLPLSRSLHLSDIIVPVLSQVVRRPILSRPAHLRLYMRKSGPRSICRELYPKIHTSTSSSHEIGEGVGTRLSSSSR